MLFKDSHPRRGRGSSKMSVDPDQSAKESVFPESQWIRSRVSKKSVNPNPIILKWDPSYEKSLRIRIQISKKPLIWI